MKIIHSEKIAGSVYAHEMETGQWIVIDHTTEFNFMHPDVFASFDDAKQGAENAGMIVDTGTGTRTGTEPVEPAWVYRERRNGRLPDPNKALPPA